MRKIFALIVLLLLVSPVQAFGLNSSERAVKNVILSQFRYANKGNFDKFISTFDES